MARTVRDYYRVLGLSPGADRLTIERVYREIISQIDEELDLGESAEELDQLRREVMEAHRVLGDAESRREYDAFRSRRTWWSEAEEPDLFVDGDEPDLEPAGVMDGVLRRFLTGSIASEREVLEVLLPFEMAALGGQATLRIPMRAACTDCGGTGGVAGRGFVCPECRGASDAAGECPVCHGRGWIVTAECAGCDGRGWVPALGECRLEVPAGVHDGTLLPFPGFGQARGGNAHGPRYVRVSVSDHPFFSRRGRDIVCRVPVSESVARNGSVISVRTLRGRKQRVTIPPDSRSGTVVRLKGEGIELSNGERGDQLVEIQVTRRSRNRKRHQ